MRRKIPKQLLKRQKMDIHRPLRVVKYIDYPFVLEDSPVELDEGYIVSDRDTCQVFACFIFKNVGERPIRKLDICVSCYLNQNIPYENIEFTYSAQDLTFGIINKNGEDMKLRDANERTFIEKSEAFGSCVFIPIPEAYFKKLEVVISSVEYINGDEEKLDLLVAGDGMRYSDLDQMSKLVYSRMNIYVAAEEKFPTKVVPQFGNRVWLCCCGTKNPIGDEICEKCGREKTWQMESVSSVAIEESKKKMIADPTERSMHDKSRFAQNKYLENDADIQQKIKQYEKAMENIAAEEKRRERNMMMVVPKMIFWVLGVYLLVSVLQYIAFGGGLIGVIVDSVREIYNIINSHSV